MAIPVQAKFGATVDDVIISEVNFSNKSANLGDISLRVDDGWSEMVLPVTLVKDAEPLEFFFRFDIITGGGPWSVDVEIVHDGVGSPFTYSMHGVLGHPSS